MPNDSYIVLSFGLNALLDLKKALDLIYERSLYQLSIDYQKDPPPPALTDDDRAWMAATVKVL